MLKKALMTSILVGLSSVAMAGPWTVKVGASYVDITGQSDLASGSVKDVQAASKGAFTPSIEYRFADTPFSAEILLANPISHNVAAAGLGDIVSLKELPPTLTAKYNFTTLNGFTPYVGAGMTVFIPWDVKGIGALAGTDVDADAAVGAAAQVGFNFQPADAKNWGVYVDVRYADLSTKVKLAGTDIGKLDLNPVVYSLGYSYTF